MRNSNGNLAVRLDGGNSGTDAPPLSAGEVREIRGVSAVRSRVLSLVMASALILPGLSAISPASLAMEASVSGVELRIESDSLQYGMNVNTHYNYNTHTAVFEIESELNSAPDSMHIGLEPPNQAATFAIAQAETDPDSIESAWLGNFARTLVSIEPVRNRIVEGELAQFMVRSSKISPQLLSIEYELEGNVFGDIDLPEQINFCECDLPSSLLCTTCDRDTSNVRIVSLPTIDDSLDELDGRITARLVTDGRFEIGSDVAGLPLPLGEATIIVADNDEAGAQTAVQADASPEDLANERAEIASVWIVSRSDEVAEGETVFFDVVSSLPLQHAVAVQVFTEGDFFTGRELPTAVELRDGNTGAIAVDTVNDRIIEPNGRVRVVLRTYGEQFYTINPDFPADVTVIVLDNDELSQATMVSIEPVEETVEQGSPARFKLTSTVPTFVTVKLLMSTRGDVFTGADLPTSVAFNGGTEAFVEIPTLDDQVIAGSGRVNVVLLEDLDYGFSADGSIAATVEVVSNDIPFVAIDSVTETIFEGEAARFRISSTKAMNGSVNLAVRVAGDYFADPILPTSVELGGGTQAFVEVPTVNDGVFKYSGRVYAKILAGDGYAIANPNGALPESHQAMVIVQNNDPRFAEDEGLPFVWIEPVNPVVTEGSPAEIRVRTSHPSPEYINVEVPLTIAGGDVFRESPETLPRWIGFSGSGGETSVFTEDDGVFEQDGILTAQLLPGPGYRVHEFEGREATVVVRDNDVPPIVSVTTTQDSVEEGNAVTYLLRATESVPSVQIRTGFVGSFFTGDSDRRTEEDTVFLDENNERLSVQQLTDDQVAGEDGSFFVEILASADYAIDEDNSRIDIVLLDNDSLVLTLHSNPPLAAVEGQPVVFHVESTAAPAEDTVVTLHYTDLLDGTSIDSYSTVTLAAGQTRSTTHTYVLEPLASVQEERRFYARIDAVANFAFEESEGSKIILPVQDDPDAAIPAEPEPPVTTADDTGGLPAELPVVSIELADNSPIVEGESVELVLTASTPSPVDLLVWISAVQDSGYDFVADGFERFQIGLTAGSTATSVPIDTVDDDVFEDDGVVRFEIAAGPGYLIGDADSVDLAVEDNDSIAISQADSAPELAAAPALESETALAATSAAGAAAAAFVIPGISIALADSAEIEEGGTAELVLTSTDAVDEELQIRISVEQGAGSDFMAEGGAEILVALAAGATFVSHPVATVDDELVENHGTITFEVADGEGYVAGETAAVELQVRDNDTVAVADSAEPVAADLPTVSIESLVTQPIYEGEIAEFVILLSHPHANDLTVNIAVIDELEMNFIEEEEIAVPVLASHLVAVFELNTVDDDVVEDDGTVALEIEPSEEFVLGLSNSAEFSVLDNDNIDPLEISISSLPEAMTGDLAEFIISANRNANEDIIINVSVDGEGLLWSNLELTVPMIEGENEARLFVPTGNRDVGNREVSVTALVEEGNGYVVSQIDSETTVVLQDTIETAIVSIAAVNEEVDEGDMARFEVSSTQKQAVPLEVWADVVVSRRNLPSLSEVTSVQIPAGENNETVEIPTSSSFEFTGTSEVKMSLLTGDSYELSPQNQAIVTVNRNEIPLVTVEPRKDSGAEGEDFSFDFSIRPAAVEGFNLNVEVAQNGDFVGTPVEPADRGVGRTQLQVSPGASTVSLNVVTADDGETESDGSVSVTLLSGTGYRIPLNSTTTVASQVLDNDAPRITVAKSTVSTITEGDSFTFTVTAATPILNDTLIYFGFEEEDGLYLQSGTEQRYLMEAGKSSLSVPLQTEDDEIDEATGTLTVFLLPGEGYNVAEEEALRQTSVEVEDNDEIREIAIAAVSETVVEGELAQFELTASATVYREVLISVFSSAGDFVSEDSPVAVLMDETTSQVFAVPTDDDDVDEADGDINVAILASDSYISNEDRNLATVQVTDNDDHPLIAMADAQYDTVVEGSTVQFELVASHGNNSRINVVVSGSLEGYVPSESSSVEVVFDGSDRATFAVEILHTDELTENLTIRAIVLPGSGYMVAEAPDDSTSVAVVDSRFLPEVTIAAANGFITEGETAEFIISATYPNTASVAINVVTDGDFVVGQVLPTFLSFDSSNQAVLIIETDDDDTDEFDGSITVELLPNEGAYTVADAAASIVTTRVFDDDLQTLAIKSSVPYAVDGSSIEFTVEAQSPVEESLSLSIEIRDGGDNVGKSHFQTVTIPAGRDRSDVAVYYVPKQETYDFNRRVTATVVSEGSDFRFAALGRLATVYLVGQSLPVISIESVESAPVGEGNPVSFRLNTLFASASDVPVRISVSDEGAGFISGVIEKTVILPANEEFVIFDIQTIDDVVDRNDAVVTAFVLNDGGYNLDQSYADIFAQTTVRDNDVPVLSIRGGESVVEGSGEQVAFEISSNIVRDERDLIVYYMVDQGASNLIDLDSLAGGRDSVRLLAGGLTETATITFDVIDDMIDENLGAVTVTLLVQTDEGDDVVDYALPAEQFRDSVVVLDDDVPVLSITGGDPVTEGDNVFAVYTVSSDIKRESRNFDVTYSIDTGTSNFLASKADETINYAATPAADFAVEGGPKATDVAVIRLPIVNDRIDENDGSVTVAILEPNTTDYTVNSAAASADVSVADDDVPVISIAGGTAVTEGDDVYAVYTVSSDIKREGRNLNVAYSIDTGTSNFLSSTANASIELAATPAADIAEAGAPKATDVAEIRLQIVNDRIDEDDGSVTVAILTTDQTVYSASAATGSASVSVADDDVPVISVAGGAAVTEGDDVYAVFTVSADIKRDGKDLEIAYSIDTGTSNFLSDTDDAVIELAATPVADLAEQGAPKSTDVSDIRLQIENDRIDENDGTITVTIATNTATETIEYTVSTDAADASVAVADDDVPVISVAGGSGVTEGDNVFAVYTFTSDIDREGRDLEIAYSIDTGSSNFLSDTADAEITLAATPTAATTGGGAPTADAVEIRLPVVNDIIDENDGSITVMVKETDPAVYTADSTNGSAAVAVADDDVPVLSIAAGAAVTEGDNVFAVYTVTSDIKRDAKDLDVSYTIATGTGNFLSTTADATITLAATTAADLSAAGAPSATDNTEIRLQIVNDRIDENNGTITVTLVETDAAVYTVIAAADDATVNVADDDVPVISIEGGPAVTEGDNVFAVFTVKADIKRAAKDLEITYSIDTGTSNFLASTANATVQLMATTPAELTVAGGPTDGDEAEIKLPIVNDNVSEDNGSIAVTVVVTDATVYTASTNFGTASVAVTDDDSGPEITLSLQTGHSGEITEGQSITLDLGASVAPSQNIIVNASVTPPASSFLDNYTAIDGKITVTGTISQGATAGTLQVNTQSDDVDEAKGMITVALVNGTGYVLDSTDSTKHTIQFTVNDDDKPAISIALAATHTDGSVTEGGTATFDINASIAPFQDITVTAHLTPVESDFLSEYPATDVDGTDVIAITGTISARGTTGTIDVVIKDNSTIDAARTIIRATLIDGGDDYEVAQKADDAAPEVPDPSFAEVTVLDDDSSGELETNFAPIEAGDATDPLRRQDSAAANTLPPPVVSIAAASVTVNEGEIITLIVTADSVQSGDLPVSILVNQGERSIIAGVIPATVTISSGSSETELNLQTFNDGLETEDGEIVFSIRDRAHYELNAEQSSVTVTVIDIENAERTERYMTANDSIIPETLTAMGTSLVDALSSNVESAFVIGVANEFLMEIGHQSSIQDILQYKAQDLNDSAYSWASMLEGTSFRLPVEPSTDVDASVTGWGSGSYSLLFDDENDEVTRSGQLYTAHLGFDTVYRNGLLLGAAATYFESDIEYSVGDSHFTEESAHRTQMNGLHPYIGWASEDRIVELWTSAGYGQGGIEIEEGGENLETMDSTYYLFAFGNSNRLYATSDSFFGGESEYRLRSEAWTSNMQVTNGTGGLEDASYSVHRVRIATEGTHSVTLESETYVQTAASVGMRWDIGSDKQGLGLETGANMTYQLPVGLTFEPGGRILMGRADILREWGLSGSVLYDGDLDGIGLQVNLAPTWGDTNSSDTQQLWETGVFDDDDEQKADEYEARMDTELGYGFYVFDRLGTITPFGGINLRERGLHQYRLGTRFTIGTNFNLIIESGIEPPEYADEEMEREISANGSFRW